MSREQVPGHDITYHLVCYDDSGNERGNDSGAALAEARTGITDVFVFSHGWNGDVPAARSQYGAWIAAMANCTAEREEAHASAAGFRALVIGLHWPSKAWGDEEVGSASFGVGEGVDAEALTRSCAERLGGGSARLAAVRTIVGSALEDAAPLTLSREVRQAYGYLDASTVDETDVHDRAPFDAERLYQACLLEDLASFGGLSLGGILAPLRMLTFWKMKNRARTFGETGAAALVRDLQRAAPSARIHLMGHSFGCIVACAAALGADNPISTLTLVQGAMSLWAFAPQLPDDANRSGYFHPVVARHRVTGPVLVTTSPFDHAVCRFYPLGARSGRQVSFGPHGLPKYGAIGQFGVQSVDARQHDLTALGELTPGHVHNVDARAVIRNAEGIAGAHNDICHPEVGRMLWRAVIDARATRSGTG